MSDSVETVAPVTPASSSPDTPAKSFVERVRENAAKFAAQQSDPPPTEQTTTETPTEATTEVASDVSGGEQPPVEGATKDASGRWRGPDGKFVSAAVDAGTPDAGTEGEESETLGEPVLFTLAGDKERGEDDLELDLTGLPPDAIDRLNRIKNDGMRRQEFNKQKAVVDQRLTELKAVETEIQVNPVGFVLDRLAPTIRRDVAKALVLEEWDTIIDELARYAESDGTRKLALSDVRDGLRQSREKVDAMSAHERRASDVMNATRGLIPETASEEDAQDFIVDAARLFEDMTRQGLSVEPEKVPEYLASRLRRYGFQPAPQASGSPTQIPKLAVASPKGPNAQQLAEKAKAQQQRLKVAQQSRTNGAAVAPAGAGATPTTRLQPPKGQTIEERAKWVRQHGFTPAAS